MFKKTAKSFVWVSGATAALYTASVAIEIIRAPGDTSQDQTRLAAVMASTSADTGLMYISNAVTEEEYRVDLGRLLQLFDKYGGERT